MIVRHMANEADGWYRELRDERIQIYLTGGDTTLRATGPADVVQKLSAAFQEGTGLTVADPERKSPLFGMPRQLEGQVDLFDQNGEPSCPETSA